MQQLLTTAELAARWGVSPQTVRNRLAAGMPHAGKARDGGYLFDPDAAERWKAGNTGGKAHGGKRQGAGRKPGRRRTTTDPTPPTAIEARAAIAQRAAAGTPPPHDPHGPHGLLTAADLLNVTAEELRALVALAPDETHLTKAQAERLKTLQEARRLDRLEREAAGELVNAEAVRLEFARVLAGYRRRLEELPGRLLARRPELEAARDELDAEVARLVAEIAGDA